MSLHLRKMMAQQIEDSKSTYHVMPSLDFQETQLLGIMEQASEDPQAALGALCVVSADLLETARRADPAYGLTEVDA